MIKPLKHDTMETNKIETNKMENGILLVATYNTTFRNLSTTLRKNFTILYSGAEVRTVLTPRALGRV